MSVMSESGLVPILQNFFDSQVQTLTMSYTLTVTALGMTFSFDSSQEYKLGEQKEGVCLFLIISFFFFFLRNFLFCFFFFTGVPPSTSKTKSITFQNDTATSTDYLGIDLVLTYTTASTFHINLPRLYLSILNDNNVSLFSLNK
jgi:hypothetical protein